MNILVQPLNTEEQLLVEEWLKEQQISFESIERHLNESQLNYI